MSNDVTAQFGFNLIDYNFKPWDALERANWRALDLAIAGISAIPGYRGVWTNGISYASSPVNRVIDSSSMLFYQCLVSNISPSTGTFADYRAANPTHWQLVDQFSLQAALNTTLANYYTKAEANNLASGAPKARTVLSGAYIVVAADKGKTFTLNGTFTLTTSTAPSLGNGFFFYVSKSDGSGKVTYDPDGSELVDGKSTISIFQESFLIWTDGTAWYTVGRPKGWIPISSATLNGLSTTLQSFSDGFLDNEIAEVQIKYSNLVLSSSGSTTVYVVKSSSIVTSSTYSSELDSSNGTTTNHINSGLTGTAQALLPTNVTGPVIGEIFVRDTLSSLGSDGVFDVYNYTQAATRRGRVYQTDNARVGGIVFTSSVNMSSITYTVKGYRP